MQLYGPVTMHARQRNGKSRAEFRIGIGRKPGVSIVGNQNAPPLKCLPTEQGRRAESEMMTPNRAASSLAPDHIAADHRSWKE
jgi:hypothetical protein